MFVLGKDNVVYVVLVNTIMCLGNLKNRTIFMTFDYRHHLDLSFFFLLDCVPFFFLFSQRKIQEDHIHESIDVFFCLMVAETTPV